MPFEIPTIKEIHQRVEADLEASLEGEINAADMPFRNALVRVLARVFAGAIHVLYRLLKTLAENYFPWSAVGVWLERWAEIWNITRKDGTFAYGRVSFTGTESAVLASGTLCQRSDGVQYEILDDAVIEFGELSVPVECLRSGKSGNLPAGVPVSLVSPVSGIDTAGKTTSPGINGGFDPEDDESLRDRLFERIQNPPQGGSESDYVRWAREVPGVTRAWAIPQGYGPNTVVVIIATDGPDGSIQPPPGLTETTAVHIRTRAPVTAEVFVVEPIPLPVLYRLTISPDSPTLRAAVASALLGFHRTLGPGDPVRPSRVSEIVSTTPGEEYHRLDFPTADVQPERFEVATYGGVTWTA